MAAKQNELKTAQDALNKLIAQSNKVASELTQLEQESKSLDVTEEGAIDKLSSLESGMTARRRALESFKVKISEARAAVNLAERHEQERMAAGLLERRDQITADIVAQLKELKDSLDELENVKTELKAKHKIGTEDILGLDFPRALNYVLTQRAGFYPALFGGKARPSTREIWIQSAEYNLKNARARLDDFKKRQGYGSVRQEDVTEAEWDVENAERQLRRAKGETVDAMAEERAEAQEKKAANEAEYNSMISSWKAGWQKKAAELRDAAKGKKP